MEEYIENNFKSFDPVSFFEYTASEISYERAKYLFEEAIDKITASTAKPYDLVTWCINVKNNNYEIINGDEVIIYWTNREKKRTSLLNNFTDSTNTRMVAEHIANSTSSVQNKVSIVSRMKRKEVQEKKRELDRLCFNGVSVGTILKNHAETDVSYYLSLNNKAKHVVG
ncbi:hypothetical protein BD770DRAFT_377060 [Pilaira anomala]|nr:hypothetical protein BD770DRAFT_377060 [Pilaira anomala]